MSTSVTTRSGRVVKPPKDVYVPEIEEVEDDYSDDEHDSDFDLDSDEEDIATEDELEDSDGEGEWETDEDTDADENGNLEGFIDDDDVSESEAEYFA